MTHPQNHDHASACGCNISPERVDRARRRLLTDATARAKVPESDGYLAAIINFRMVANAVWWTEDAVKRITGAA